MIHNFQQHDNNTINMIHPIANLQLFPCAHSQIIKIISQPILQFGNEYDGQLNHVYEQ